MLTNASFICFKYTVILWNIITTKNNCFLFYHILNVIYSFEYKAEFSASLLQSLVSHDPSKIMFLNINNVENHCYA